MEISLVVAAANNYAIGKNGIMPWNLPADLKHFKNVTWGMPVIMGRKTYDSIGKPLIGRKNIVITRQKDLAIEGVAIVSTLEQALVLAAETDAKEAMVIGGGEIYKMAFDRATKIYLTKVDASPEADTYFPSIDPTLWELVSKSDFEADEKNDYNYSFQLWEKVR
jgi:dihydrofolate reductase